MRSKMRSKICKRAVIVGVCTCGTLIYKNHRRIWLLCDCLLKNGNVAIIRQGAVNVKVSNDFSRAS